MPKGWKCEACATKNRAADKACELCKAAKPEAKDEEYINATDEQLMWWSAYGSPEQKAKVTATASLRAAARQRSLVDKEERAIKKRQREEEAAAEHEAYLNEQRRKRREKAEAKAAAKEAEKARLAADPEHQAQLKKQREEKLEKQRMKAAAKRKEKKREKLAAAGMCEECEGEYDELQCFACGGRFCENCIDADMDDESQVCERCVSNGVGDGCRVFICASCDPADCQVCQHGEIMYAFC